MSTAAPAPPRPAPAVSRGQRVARMEQLVALRNSINAEIAEEVRALARDEARARAEQLLSGLVDPEQIEAAVVGRVATALGVSPTRGREQLRIARDLHSGLDRVRELYAGGEVDERKVAAIVAAGSWLDTDERAQLDAELAAHRISRLGLRRVGDLARSIAARIAPEKFAERAAAARRGRYVSVTPAGDGMAWLRALLPAEQAIRCLGALHKAVQEEFVGPGPVTRGRSQILADTLVERVTGTPAASTDVEVQVLVPVQSLLDDECGPLPAEIPGFGPVPADLLTGNGRRTWRRLITREGLVIGGDSRRRTFTGPLAARLRIRDGGRRTAPHCDAPIRHLDHIHRWADGGATRFDNGRGLCEFHNLVREIPDPTHPASEDLTLPGRPSDTGRGGVCGAGPPMVPVGEPACPDHGSTLRPTASRADQVGPDASPTFPDEAPERRR
ncbi:HNH endonuclease signature motif containing protein [Pseudonocardia ailaonensis]|uniref:HNH endonuclease signature motif containing protein n=1 Tax=Pseudonocardia ailaonensis TaxID=367279 RepID=A0ABN2NCI5_9PSEU